MFTFTRITSAEANDNTQFIRRSLKLFAQRPAFSLRLLTLFSAFLLAALPAATSAQVLYGSLTGTVTDQKEASVAGARVEIVNRATNETRTTTTDERGSFSLSNLQIGVYKVTITLNTFKTLVKDDVQIEANKVYRLDTHLEIGEVRETVLVSSETIPLQTDRTDLNITQTTRQINDLPLTGSLGRNYQSLMQLIPGTVGAGEQNSVAGNPQRSISFNVNGVSRMQNNTRIDGASIVYPWLPTNTVYVPPAESIDTVNIVTNSFDAEQGLAGGAAINLTIKSGTNDFHGAGWFYDTNSRFQSRSFFQPTNQPQVPKSIVVQSLKTSFSSSMILSALRHAAPRARHCSVLRPRACGLTPRATSVSPEPARRSSIRFRIPIRGCARRFPATSFPPAESTSPRVS